MLTRSIPDVLIFAKLQMVTHSGARSHIFYNVSWLFPYTDMNFIETAFQTLEQHTQKKTKGLVGNQSYHGIN